MEVIEVLCSLAELISLFIIEQIEVILGAVSWVKCYEFSINWHSNFFPHYGNKASSHHKFPLIIQEADSTINNKKCSCFFYLDIDKMECKGLRLMCCHSRAKRNVSIKVVTKNDRCILIFYPPFKYMCIKCANTCLRKLNLVRTVNSLFYVST